MHPKSVSSIPKLLPPKITDVYQRERLFDVLDEKKDQRVVWISSPAGSGKTTLIASYLAERDVPAMWYQIDEGDTDVASFFHYLGISEQKFNAEKFTILRNLTPEYQQSLSVFARNYFREFFSRIDGSSVLVFDNYQDAPDDCLLHTVIDILIDETPDQVQIVVISRVNPPAKLSRRSLSPDFSILNWGQVKLTDDECLGVIKKKSGTGLPKTKLDAITKISQGWMAGLILLLKQNEADASSFESQHISSQSDIFGYFTNEIFNVLGKDSQQALLLTSLFPSFTMDMARALTNQGNVDKIITDLVRNQFFISQHAYLTDSFEYHPLFRAFLRNKFKTDFDQGAKDEKQRHAAHLLLDNEQHEDAANLLINVKDWKSLSTLIRNHAPSLISQGRYQTLQLWINCIPSDIRSNDPWVLYWLGNSYLAFDPGVAREHFDRAFNIFKDTKIQAGQLLSWSGVINTFLYEWGNFRDADKWIESFDELYSNDPSFPTPDIEAHVAASIFSILMWRQPRRQDLSYWAERVKSIVLKMGDGQLRVLLGNNLVIYHLWMGHLPSATLIIEALREAGTSQQSDPLTRLNWRVMEAMHAWFTANHKTCLAAMSAGNDLAESSGVHLLDLYLYAQGVYSGLSQGDIPLASRLLEKMSQLSVGRVMDKSLLHYQLGCLSWRQGDLHQAVENYQAAVELAEKTGTALPEALCRFELAATQYAQGQFDPAMRQIAKAAKLGQGMNHIEFMTLLHSAYFSLEQNDEQEGLKHLRKAMTLGAKQGYVNYPRWDNTVMAKLCGIAIESDIETEYARSLIQKRGLAPSETAFCNDTWPWPIKLYTLGRFALEVDGMALALGSKKQNKPLELLKALIAFGGKAVTEEKLTDALWPEADGDAAHHAFENHSVPLAQTHW